MNTESIKLSILGMILPRVDIRLNPDEVATVADALYQWVVKDRTSSV